MSQRSARLCLKQLNPIAAWLGEGGAALTSNHISGAAVLEYGPTEISAPIQPIWTSKCASHRPRRQPSRPYPRDSRGSLPATAGPVRDTDCPLEGDGFELLVPRHKGRGFPHEE